MIPQEKLTIEKLRKYPGLENLSDQEAENYIDTFKRFAELTYRRYLEEEAKGISGMKTSLRL